MTLEALEAKVKDLEKKLQIYEDIEQIKKVQQAYGYYLDNGMWNEMVDLFAEETESLEISDSGVYLGKAGAERFFKTKLAKATGNELPEGNINIHMQLQGYIDIDPSGKTAKGRWHCLMLKAKPLDVEIKPIIGHGYYENEYIKENGIWKFKKFHFYLRFDSSFEEGWVKSPVVRFVSGGSPDRPSTVFKPYPAQDVFPYHYKNPVTGK
ncbi:nuclear transport factor 2 family protein [Chloroflexota bacterium]